MDYLNGQPVIYRTNDGKNYGGVVVGHLQGSASGWNGAALLFGVVLEANGSFVLARPEQLTFKWPIVPVKGDAT